MIVVLAIFMSLTNSFTGLHSKADGNALTTDKDVYEIGDPIYVTAKSDEDGAWVGIYTDTGTASLYWYYVSDYPGESVNIADTVLNDGGWEGWNLGEGTFYIRLQGGSGTLSEKAITIKAGSTPESIIADKESYAGTDQVYVTVVGHAYERPWIAVLKDGSQLTWFYCNLQNGVKIDLREYVEFEGGEYTAVFYRDYNGTEVGRVSFTAETGINTVSVDVAPAANGYAPYKCGQPVLVTAASYSPKAEICLRDADPNADHGYGASGEKEPYAKFLISTAEQPVDIVAIAQQNGYTLHPGKYRLYLEIPEQGWKVQAKFELLETYLDGDGEVDWVLSEDKTEATVTLHRVDDATVTKAFTVETVKAVVTEPGCETKGLETYTASFTVDDTNRLITVNDTETFEHVFEVETDALGHQWGSWELDSENPGQEKRVCERCGEVETRPVEAHDHSEHLVKHDRVEPTCETAGNIEYYVCELCGRYYSDAAGEHEIEPTSITIPALGHNYGEWQYDAENHQHYKECANDTNHDHTIRENCTYTRKIVGGDVVYTCSECGGHYEVSIITVDKSEYLVNDSVMVTINPAAIEWYEGFNPSLKPAWIGLYAKGDTYGSGAGTVVSVAWTAWPNSPGPDATYDSPWWVENEDGTFTSDLKSWRDGGRWNEYEDGEFTLILFSDWSYNAIATIDYNVVGESLPAGEITVEFNGEAVTENNVNYSFKPEDLLIKVKSTSEDPGFAWVGFYVGGFVEGKAADYYYIYNNNGVEHDFTQLALDAWNKDHTKYQFQVVVFGDSGYDDVRQTINIEIERTPLTEEVVKEPTCTEDGMKIVTYEGDSEEHYVPIPALGHDFAAEWTFNAETHQHEKECSRCHDVIAEDCTFVDTTEGNIITHTCSVCGGSYTEELEEKVSVARVYGEDRYRTAYAIADLMKEALGVEKFSSVVLASGGDFPDALAGSYLASVKKAPILLAPTTAGKIRTLVNYLKSNVASDGTIYLLGGTAAVSQDVEDAIKAAGFKIERVAGDDRYKTNIAILKAGGVKAGDEILVCSATDFADALSAASTGQAILLVTGDKLRAAQKKYLESLGNVKFTILGGNMAVTEAMEEALKAYGTVTRLAGTDRYRTARAVAEKYYPTAEGVFVVLGTKYPDGLCAGPLAYLVKAPMLMATSTNTRQAQTYVDAVKPQAAIVFGGATGIDDSAARKIFRLDETDEIIEFKR